jgi:hypothetical protein
MPTHDLIATLKARFEQNSAMHPEMAWEKVQAPLEANLEKLSALEEMERTGGALFRDRRPDRVFIYLNGASSYFAARGFRASLPV